MAPIRILQATVARCPISNPWLRATTTTTTTTAAVSSKTAAARRSLSRSSPPLTAQATATAVAAVLGSSSSHDGSNNSPPLAWWWLGTATAAAAAAVVTTTTTSRPSNTRPVVQCEATDSEVSPASVAKDDTTQMFDMDQQEDRTSTLPVYTADQVAHNNGEDGRPVWMSYGGVVYDVTTFIPNHPGGSEKIRQAAGQSIEPYWHLYRQHYASDLPMRLMERMVVGRLAEDDQNAVDEQMAVLEETDPYADEPLRHSDLKVHSDTPMNAETPATVLTKSYLTPNSLFYIRHHHPVPQLSAEEIKKYTLAIQGPTSNRRITLDEIKKLPAVTRTITLQCSGNRRSGFNQVQRTSGTDWIQGAISTAKFKGILLKDLLEHVGVKPDDTTRHVIFHAVDGMSASVGVEKAFNPYGDVLVAYEMNGEPLPPDHGYPLRVLVPGYGAVRSVKWVTAIELSEQEADGPWQRGLNYKILPPSVTDAADVDLTKMPSIGEGSVFSGITALKFSSRTSKRGTTQPVAVGDTVMVQASGWAYAGGGRNIVRVDVTGDEGETWQTAQLTAGTNQPAGRAWAWVFWEAAVPAKVVLDSTNKPTVRLASKAVDAAFNVQPESCRHTWNVRGLGNNSWYRVEMHLPKRLVKE